MNWLWITGMLFAGGIGFFTGTTLVSVGLRRDIADLEAEKLALDLERSKPAEASGNGYARKPATGGYLAPVTVVDTGYRSGEAARLLRAALIRAGMANANDAGFWN